MNGRWLKVLMVVGALTAASQAFARGGETSVASISPSAPIAQVPAFAERIVMLIDQRSQMVDQIAPQPAANSTDPAAVARRLAALQELDAFVRVTVDGLINAAPSAALKAATEDELAPVMLVHQDEVAIALVELLELPLVNEKGWFVISRFGADAERHAAQLLQTAAMEPAYKRDLVGKLRILAAHGEASTEGLKALEDLKTAARP